jgi:chaperone BCS1
MEPLEPSSPEDLDKIAAQFAKRVPGNTFTPAEIQGFLLTRKKEPTRALEEVEKWVETEKAAKETK